MTVTGAITGNMFYYLDLFGALQLIQGYLMPVKAPNCLCTPSPAQALKIVRASDIPRAKWQWFKSKRTMWSEPLQEHMLLVGGLEHEFYDFPVSWEFHNPNWRTHVFQRGRYTTNQVTWQHGPWFCQNLTRNEGLSPVTLLCEGYEAAPRPACKLCCKRGSWRQWRTAKPRHLRERGITCARRFVPNRGGAWEMLHVSCIDTKPIVTGIYMDI